MGPLELLVASSAVVAEFEANLLYTCCYLCSGCGCVVAVGTELGLWAMS